jgi:PAS domain-containing protein
MGILPDITERKVTEAAVAESATRLRAIADTAVDAIIIDGGRAQGGHTSCHSRPRSLLGPELPLGGRASEQGLFQPLPTKPSQACRFKPTHVAEVGRWLPVYAVACGGRSGRALAHPYF